MPVVSIAICTYDRRDLLAAALDSVVALTTRVPFETVVVDNSDTAAGHPETRALVEAAAARTAAPVRHVAARGPNISVARNAAIEATSGELLGFIDDDMVVPPTWVDAVVAAMAEADVLLGLVRAKLLPGGTVAHAEKFFDRKLDLPDGALVRPDRFGHYRGGRTSNAVFRRATTFGRGVRFDPQFGRVGGEDTDVFAQLAAFAPRVRWSTAVLAEELIPAARQTEEYLALREFRGSQVLLRIAAKHSGKVSTLYHQAVGAAQLATSGGRPADPDAALEWLLARARARGKIFWTRGDPRSHYH